MLLYSKLPYK